MLSFTFCLHPEQRAELSCVVSVYDAIHIAGFNGTTQLVPAERIPKSCRSRWHGVANGPLLAVLLSPSLSSGLQTDIKRVQGARTIGVVVDQPATDNVDL
jgi:hypothetical protein